MFVVTSLPSGCVAAVGDKDGFLYLSTPGNFTYGEPAPVTHFSPPMTNTVCLINGMVHLSQHFRVYVYGFCFQTLFDVASLTKVLATTTAAMILYQKGQLDLGIR